MTALPSPQPAVSANQPTGQLTPVRPLLESTPVINKELQLKIKELESAQATVEAKTLFLEKITAEATSQAESQDVTQKSSSEATGGGCLPSASASVGGGLVNTLLMIGPAGLIVGFRKIRKRVNTK